MTLSIIAAVAANRAIGKDNDLMWHISEDLKHFKKLTVGHSIVMGRKTFESFPVRPLPKRRNIIITRQADYHCPSCDIVDQPNKAIELCRGEEEVFIGGGAGIYAHFLNQADIMYLTHVHKAFEGDTFFPEFDSERWEIIAESETKTDAKSGLDFHFAEYIRKP